MVLLAKLTLQFDAKEAPKKRGKIASQATKYAKTS
jgi:hypothetical protein